VTLGYAGPGLGSFGPGNAFEPLGNVPFIPDGRTTTFPDQRPSPDALTTLFATYGIAMTPEFLPRNNLGFNADGTLFTTGNGMPGSVLNYRGAPDPYLTYDSRYSYNYAPFNYLQLPLERVSAFGRASFEMTPAVEVYAEALYARYTAETALAPTPVAGIPIARANPYIPADYGPLLDSRVDAAADVLLFRRFAEFGPRHASTEHDARQVTVGARGQISGDWNYDLYLQAGTNDASETQTGLTLLSRLQELTFAADGGVAACGGLNLFGPGSISAQCVSYLALEATNETKYQQTVAEATLTGHIFFAARGRGRNRGGAALQA
jgi:hypothetical protein